MAKETVSIITKLGARRATRVAEQIEAFLLSQGKGVVREAVGPEVGLVVVLGGDGTLLHVAEAAYRYDAQILGVNLGGLGYLTEIKVEEVEGVLLDFFSHRATIEERMLLEVTHHDHKGQVVSSHIALNEIAILRGPYGKVINIPTWADNSFLTTYRGDGLIIATPTGSTAYNLSAGGPILHPILETMILTPVCPFALSARPILLPAEMVLRVGMEASIEQSEDYSISPPPLYVEIDGRMICGVLPGHTLEIKRAERRLKLLSSPSSGYFQILREKLGWAGHLST